MWFPIDQPGYAERAPRRGRAPRARSSSSRSGRTTTSCRSSTSTTTRSATTLPPNFDDDLLDKPDAQRQWRWDQQHGLWGYIDPTDTKAWLRHLDYYVKLHQMADDSLGTVLGALDESGAADDTIVIFTSDHGDMCGSHGLRSKGPFVYEEIMHVPLYVRVPGVTTPGTQTDALGTHVDLASTIVALGGRRSRRAAIASRRDLSPVLADPAASVRDHVLFAHDTAHTEHINQTRYAIRGFFDGQHEVRALLRRRWRQARYRTVGQGPGPKLFDVDAAFDDQEHEWYDLDDDPHELVNLAHDRGRRSALQDNFDRLLEYEAAAAAAIDARRHIGASNSQRRPRERFRNGTVMWNSPANTSLRSRRLGYSRAASWPTRRCMSSTMSR